VPVLLLGSFFAAYSRQSSAGTIIVVSIIGAFGGALSLVVHELGHVRVARKIQGVRPVRIALFSMGAATYLDGAYRSGRDQLRVALGGPAASFAFALPMFALIALPVATPLRLAAFLLGLLNIAIGAFSLLPLHPLDGHKFVVGVVWALVRSESRARQIVRRTGRALFALDVAAGSGLIIERPLTGGITLIVVGSFLVQKKILRRASSSR
jgi:Zn-dependent protease